MDNTAGYAPLTFSRGAAGARLAAPLPVRSTAFLLLLVLGWGCAERVPLPITATELRQQWSGPALIAYLGQPDASAAVCDLRPPRPGLIVSIPADVRETLVDGLVEGTVPPVLWRACVERMLRTADGASVALLLDQVAHSYGRALSDQNLETNPTLQARVEAMEIVFLDSPPDHRADPDVMAALVSDVREAVTRGRFGPWAARHGAGLLEAMDIEQGRVRGRVVDRARLDQLLAAGDEALLLRCSQHLPTPELRTEARRRVIRLRIQASPDPALRADAAAIEQTVMKFGVNRVSPSAHAPLRARVKLPVRQVLVRQQVLERTAMLLGAADQRPGLSVVPDLPLRHALEIDLEGLTRPVTICAPLAALDPEPCLAADEITVENPLVTLDREGVLHFVDHLSVPQVTRLAQEDQQIVLPISIAGRRLVAVTWALAFEKPADLTLRGNVSGPDLRVRVERGAGTRLVQTVRAAGETYVAVVERADTPTFRIVSRGPDGGAGMNGQPGSDGSAGLSGSNASCPSSSGEAGGPGSDGSAGGDGGGGGNAGNGGAIQVEIACGVARCDDLVALLRTTIVSVGGSGGPGGSGGDGGRGGRGGMGGSSTSCITDDGSHTLFGGRDGLSGRDGIAGRSGFPGSAGVPGAVSVRVVE